MPTQNKWDQHWLEVADVFSKLSKDIHTKVGAIIVTPDNRQCSGGYNGFPAGWDDTDPKLWERPTKYDIVIHAEINAIINCPFDTKGCYVYTTITPCHRCMLHMINAGIERVIYGDLYENLSHHEIWSEAVNHFEQVYMFKDGKRTYC